MFCLGVRFSSSWGSAMAARRHRLGGQAAGYVHLLADSAFEGTMREKDHAACTGPS